MGSRKAVKYRDTYQKVDKQFPNTTNDHNINLFNL